MVSGFSGDPMGSLASTVTITLAANQYREARDAALRTCRDIGARYAQTEFSEEIQVAEMSPLLRYAARSPTPGNSASKTTWLSCYPNCYIVLSLRCRKNPIL